ncbi:DUF2332 domain-containing protein [Sneathiella glossodoripedis]|uniref:DUF2332 domain-containing protein n=1 Tax=Sneathiella glossodoripedis TaxID=418853 RepID=UPI000470B68C|nr:DUF2332 family protein [Sneathiella glossodoripedis]
MSENKISDAMLSQAVSCNELGSPFTARILSLVAKRYPQTGAVWSVMKNWPGDLGPSGDSVSLRFCGALHAIVLEKLNPNLAEIYKSHAKGVTDNQLMAAIEEAVEENEDFVLQYLKSAPQTNEVRRAGILLPAFMEVAKRTGINKFVMSELGASAGLNMLWDKYRYDYGGVNFGNSNSPVRICPDVSGQLPEFQNVDVFDRSACDLNPVDVTLEKSVTRLLSYIWADQQDRIDRTRNAVELFKGTSASVEKSDAIEWLDLRLQQKYSGAVHIIYHTIAWQYFPDERQVQGRNIIEQVGRNATDNAPLAWVFLEADDVAPGAGLYLQLWPGGQKILLGRGDYHGRWINWLI